MKEKLVNFTYTGCPICFAGNGNSGFFRLPNDFPSLQDLTGGFGTSVTNRRGYQLDAARDQVSALHPSRHQRQRKRLLIALDPDYVQSQRLLSEKL